jgi:hypothetical protein
MPVLASGSQGTAEGELALPCAAAPQAAATSKVANNAPQQRRISEIEMSAGRELLRQVSR